MDLLERLRGVASKLGIIRIVEAKPAQKRPKLTTRSVTLDQLLGEVRAEEVRALSQLPAEMSVPFEQVFDAAGIKPPAHGWTAQRLQQLLATEEYRPMDRAAAQKAVLAALAADKADVEDVVRDAVARDQAIDAYEQSVHSKMDARSSARQRRMAELEGQMQQLQGELERLRREAQADREQWSQWQARKRAYEHDLADAVGHLLDKPIITVSPAPGEAR